MTTSTPEVKAVQLAQAEIKAKGLKWVPGTGYRLGMAKICKATGMGYSATYTAIYSELLPAAERIKVEGVTEAALGQRIADARKTGQSWGYIMMRTGLTAGRVQKLFALATGVQAQGLRIGRGGRYAAHRPELYTGKDRKVLGTEVPVGAKAATVKPTVTRKVKVTPASRVVKATK